MTPRDWPSSDVRITRARILPNADAAVFEILGRSARESSWPSGIKALYFARRMSDTR